MLEEKVNQEERERKLENVHRNLKKLRTGPKKNVYYISAIVLLAASALYLGIRNFQHRRELEQIPSIENAAESAEYNALQRRAEELSEQLSAREAEIERLRQEISQYDNNQN